MNNRLLLFLVGILAFVSRVSGQDPANFTQFYLNPYILNPSFAGIDGKTAAGIIYKKQWLNVSGSPSVTNFNLHTPINTKTATGLTITNDSRGLLSSTSLMLSLAYNAAVGDNSYLRFGASAGGSWNMVDIDALQGLNDPAVGNLSGNHASLAGNAGLSFHAKSFHIGVALPYIFSPQVLSENGFAVSKVSPFESTVIHTSYRFYAKHSPIVFEPYLVYRFNTLAPPQLEAAAVVHLNNVIWFGGSYKQSYGISGVGGIKLNNKVAIGAAYTLKNSGPQELGSPGIEISLNFLLGEHKKNTHVYSFVDTHKERVKKHPYHKKTDEIAKQHQAAEAARKRALSDQAKKREAEALAKHQATVNQKVEQRKNDVVKPDTSAAPGHTPRFTQATQAAAPTAIPEGHHEHEQAQLKRLEVHAEDAKEHHNEAGHPHAERHEFVKKGDHDKELDVADYVIGGVFKGETNAKNFSEGLNKLGFHSHFGHLTEKNLWYVYVMKTTDINTAKAERDKARKMKILKDAWLLTVHH